MCFHKGDKICIWNFLRETLLSIGLMKDRGSDMATVRWILGKQVARTGSGWNWLRIVSSCGLVISGVEPLEFCYQRVS
jgi:hypothetical protein